MKTKKLKILVFSFILIFSIFMAFKSMNNVENEYISLNVIKNTIAIAQTENPPSNECGCYVCSPWNTNNACRLDCKWWEGWICG